jgi:hypothetical protein
MKLIQKLLLALAVTGLGGGIFLTVSRAKFPPGWAVVLPLGATVWGLFLITFLLQNEVAKFDEEEHLKMESARRCQSTAAFDKGKKAKDPRTLLHTRFPLGILPRLAKRPANANPASRRMSLFRKCEKLAHENDE